ncbi:hypothetical protein [Pseudomonas paeninsulae]|uniref:hypothetical protein n=1 Tax=Pseudomonas paeninsulae TaxID=3110772 RepID=UPI002D777542|nr:hypothetical protein [Pseudomonas sp. IT1137]
MSQPQLMLGGVPIVLHAGAPVLSDDPIGAEHLHRMSDGAGIKATLWERAAGSISAQGWMPPGLGALDYSQPLEFRSTQVDNMISADLVFTLPSTPRPDQAPWAFALVGDEWLPAACSTVDGEVTVTAVTGASLYQVAWMPVYSVFASRPARGYDSGAGAHSWSMAWEEA